jgi:hypothetical protein
MIYGTESTMGSRASRALPLWRTFPPVFSGRDRTAFRDSARSICRPLPQRGALKGFGHGVRNSFAGGSALCSRVFRQTAIELRGSMKELRPNGSRTIRHTCLAYAPRHRQASMIIEKSYSFALAETTGKSVVFCITHPLQSVR